MYTHYWTLLKNALLITFCVTSCRSLVLQEYGPQPLNTLPLKNENIESAEVAESPKDVASVSKFIKEFHRRFEEDPFTGTERTEKISETMTEEKSAVLFEAPVTSENVTAYVNETESNSTNSSTTIVNCSNERQPGVLSVELVNSTRLLSLLTTDVNITSKTTKANCVVLLFYARTCPFSCMAAPHFNALPRAFPAVKMAAVNVNAYQSFNTQYGIVGVPTVMLFHNGRPAAKFNDSEYTLEMFTRFITKYTGLAPQEKMFVTSADFGGPVPSVIAKETDYWLALAWAVIGCVGGIAIGKSRAWRAVVEAVQNAWREAEAQHPHSD
ncbi:thioredoxin domain-containing protein bug [Lycorma delicatula]|uniref:thioredoxin domain-containing protein bug n=1 Tax=Lycorma delicatula TaxID=130591 RepID=UPI003F51798D